MIEDTNVTAKEYRKMQKFLLLIAGCIALDQTLLSIAILLSLLMGLQIAWKERGISQLRVWPRYLKWCLLLLLATGYVSLHNPLVTHPFDCTFNFFYVVGQYVSVVWLVTRFGYCFAGKSPFSRPAPYEDGLPFWKVFMRQPFPLRMLRVLGWVAVVSVLIGIGQHYFGGATDALWVDKEANPLLRNRVFSSWENPNIFAGYLCIVAAYIMGYIGVEKNSRKRWGMFGTLLLVILCQVFTFSRGFWVAMAAEVLAFVFVFYRKGILYLLGVALAGAALAGPAVWQRLNTLRHVTEDSSAAMRLAYLEIAQAVVEDHPLGIGWYNYRYVFPEYDFYFKNPDVIMYHCHNLFLNVAAELGIPGLILFLCAWFCMLYLAVKLARKARFLWARAFAAGYLLMSLGIAVGGIGDHVLFNVRMGVLFWLLNTLLVVIWHFNRFASE
ncbi:MAG: O-antigen ligase family protein [Acidaminococcaceae bacterium]|nr:O-antigen ligase family protein [Acidaminococcaceae bacterium]